MIYYMDVGEVLSRPFTAKDTHTPRGDLMVTFTDTADGSHDECDRRAMATDILLGFSPPCFTYGSDLVLPAETNELLRSVLRSNQILQHEILRQNGRRADQIERGYDADDKIIGGLTSIDVIHRQYAAVHVPEV